MSTYDIYSLCCRCYLMMFDSVLFLYLKLLEKSLNDGKSLIGFALNLWVLYLLGELTSTFDIMFTL